MAPFRHLHVLVMAAVVVMAPETDAGLPPPERPYNFLMLLPVSTWSQLNVFMPLATGLIERGHKVTILSNHKPKEHPNITHIDPGLAILQEDSVNIFDMSDDPQLMIELATNLIRNSTTELYALDRIHQLYKRRKEFDLLIIDYSDNQMMLPFAHEHSYITICTMGLEPMQSAVVGNVQNPAYVSNTIAYYFSHPMSFLERISNVYYSITFALRWRYYTVSDAVQPQISKLFPDLPSLFEIERNQSLVLLNTHFSLSTPLPLLPGQVEVGCMQCTKGKPLPKNLDDFVSGTVPVIYFSLGSYVRGDTMPQHLQDLFINAFRKLPYKLLWKFETQKKNLPSNVMIHKWIPQQDVLAHPNVKLFISHCGLLSTQEASYHGMPILGLPVFFDQQMNADKLQKKGLGKTLLWEELTEDLIIATIEELVGNPSYLKKLSTISAIFRDQPLTPVETAVYWTEYVTRHAGAVHLRSPEQDLSWVELLHLDILLVFHLMMFLMVKVVKKAWRICFAAKVSGKKKRKKD